MKRTVITFHPQHVHYSSHIAFCSTRHAETNDADWTIDWTEQNRTAFSECCTTSMECAAVARSESRALNRSGNLPLLTYLSAAQLFSLFSHILKCTFDWLIDCRTVQVSAIQWSSSTRWSVFTTTSSSPGRSTSSSRRWRRTCRGRAAATGGTHLTASQRPKSRTWPAVGQLVVTSWLLRHFNNTFNERFKRLTSEFVCLATLPDQHRFTSLQVASSPNSKWATHKVCLIKQGEPRGPLITGWPYKSS